MDSVRISGYSQQYRAQSLSVVLDRGHQMGLEGLRYRIRQKIEDAKAGRHHKWINTRFLKDKYTRVFHVQARVEGWLARIVRDGDGVIYPPNARQIATGKSERRRDR